MSTSKFVINSIIVVSFITLVIFNSIAFNDLKTAYIQDDEERVYQQMLKHLDLLNTSITYIERNEKPSLIAINKGKSIEVEYGYSMGKNEIERLKALNNNKYLNRNDMDLIATIFGEKEKLSKKVISLSEHGYPEKATQLLNTPLDSLLVSNFVKKYNEVYNKTENGFRSHQNEHVIAAQRLYFFILIISIMIFLFIVMIGWWVKKVEDKRSATDAEIRPVKDEQGNTLRMIGSVYNITQQKKEERHLKLLESVITNTNDAIMISEVEPIDESGLRIVYINEAFTRMTGYSAEEVIGKTSIIFQGPKSDKEALKRLSDCISNWQPCEITIVNYKKNGEEFWLNLSTSPVADENGRPTHWISIERDVTEQKKAQQALQEAYDERNAVLESISDGFFTLDNNWIITYWNKSAEALLKKSKEERVGKNFKLLYFNGPETTSLMYYEKALEKREVQTFEIFDLDVNLWFEITIYPSTSGLSIYFKDISERKLIEHRLNAERNLLRTLIDSLPQTVYYKDKHARKLISNRVDYELLGAKTEENVLGKTDMEVLPPDIASVGYDQDMAILNTGRSIIDHEHSYIGENGIETWLLTTKIPLFNGGNEIVGMLGIGRDITEQKIAEKKLKALNSELESNVKQLEISNAELEQFAFIASHDLQEPLRMITSFMALLEKKYGDIIDDRGKQYINFAIDGGKRMRHIILDLLEFSRVGRIEDDFEEVDINKLIEEILTLYRRDIEEAKARIEFENLPTLQTYKTPLNQIFQNLISNSLKYHKPNQSPIIVISHKETKTHYQFSVKDNGIGIAADYFDKIFIIFQRLHNKDQYSGTGMGLSIAKKAVENLGGKIWVESEEDKGATFFFTILKSHES